ncbi:MAG: alpha/beta fold hydrolase, partial [Deltaproteobacteria bacterium]|nr:alpha/beta fold hydrolase [Deltaproteobacteria bacterium]
MFLKLRDVDLYYEVAGSGDPLLLLHGFPLNSKMWKGQVKALSRFYKVITPDLRGHGKSAAPDSPITMDMMADDMLSLLNGLKIRKCAVAGLSMGGYAAFRMYEKAKERFSCLILSDTRAEPDSAEGREKRLSLINTIKKNGIKPFNDIFIKGLLSRDCLENQQHIVDMVYSIMSEITPAGAINTLYGLMEK